MAAFAFHNAAFVLTQEKNPFAKFFTEEIIRSTGGKFSHVEFWLSGDIAKALCFSSREPLGSSFTTLDLSNPAEWSLLNLPDGFEEKSLYFCRGTEGRFYDGVGIVGIGTGQSRVHDPYARFCSETCSEIGQKVFDLPQLRGLNAWQIAPSGHPRGGYGLYELLTQSIVKSLA